VATTTIRVRADGTLESEPTRPTPAGATASPPASAAVAPPALQPPAAATPAPAAAPVVPATAQRQPAPAAPVQAARENAPPRAAPARAEPTAPPVETTTASVAPVQRAAAAPSEARASAPAPRAGAFVQVASQRSEDLARASYADLQRRFPGLLGSRAPDIRAVELADRGTFYRVRVGSFPSREEAAQFCTRLRSAGGECMVATN
jgi:cell division septation protein DedD